MTIAAGLLCTDGILIAADTCIITSDGTKQDGSKVGCAFNKQDRSSYAIANTADDGNAANSLSVNILADFKQTEIRDWLEVETIVSSHMTQWWAAFGQHKPPGVQFALGAVRDGVPRLYFCEPPNTVYQKEDYLGVGGGSATTDPLVSGLFPGYEYDAVTRLWHIAYLFHRAKKENAFCGGRTTPIYLALDGRVPTHIAFCDMQEAEELAPQLELYMREVMKRRLSIHDDSRLISSIDEVAQIMRLSSGKIADISMRLASQTSAG